MSDANAIEIKKDFINAGIIKRKTKIKVQYIEKDTNEVLEEYVEDGIVKQEYKTQRKDIDGYQKA